MRDRDAAIGYEDEGIPMRGLGRFALWTVAAAAAIGLVVLAARSDVGARRIAAALDGSPVKQTNALPAAADPAASRNVMRDEEVRALSGAVRSLAADRDRLLARIDALERSQDMTGSIPAAAPPNPAPPLAREAAPPPGFVAPSTGPFTLSSPSLGTPAFLQAPTAVSPSAAIGAPAAAAKPMAPGRRPTDTATAPDTGAAGESAAIRTEFAVDLGGDPSLEGARSLWSALKAQHGPVLDGLRPLVAVRENGAGGAIELRLVVGPLANAAAAARLCATLATAGLACQATVFEGQRLALR